jgi:Ca2+-binding EF-hand superfamily protein
MRRAFLALRSFDSSLANMTEEDCEKLLVAMDLNKDGRVDLNEFVESFRLVQAISRPPSGLEKKK